MFETITEPKPSIEGAQQAGGGAVRRKPARPRPSLMQGRTGHQGQPRQRPGFLPPQQASTRAQGQRTLGGYGDLMSPGPPQFGQMPGLPQPPQMPQIPRPQMPGPAQAGPEQMPIQTGGPEPMPSGMEMRRPGGGSVFGNPWGGFGG